MTTLQERLRRPVNWLRQESGEWKDVVNSYDRAPYEAADALDAQAAEIAALRSRLAEAEADNARLVAANKARDEFLRGHRYKHSEVDGYIDLCESQMADLKARLAEAERNEETLLGMIHHQRDVLRECLPYINESMAGRRPGRCADDIRAAVKALTADSGDERNG